MDSRMDEIKCSVQDSLKVINYDNKNTGKAKKYKGGNFLNQMEIIVRYVDNSYFFLKMQFKIILILGHW